VSASLASLRDIILREFWIHPDQLKGPPEKIYIDWYYESILFTILAWVLSVFFILHIILGTLILSSTYFVGPRDALGIMVRYVLSVIICRVILVYELAIVRAGYNNAGSQDGSQEKFVASKHGSPEVVLRTTSSTEALK